MIVPVATHLLPSYNSNGLPGRSESCGAFSILYFTSATQRYSELSDSRFSITKDQAMSGGHGSSVSVNRTTVAYGGEPTPAGGLFRPPSSFVIHWISARIVESIAGALARCQANHRYADTGQA